MLERMGDLSRAEYLGASRAVARAKRRNKWFDVCWGVKESGVGVKLDYDEEEAAWGAVSALRAQLRRFPAELWGVEVERVGSTVMVVPRAFVESKREKKRKGVYDGLRKRVKGMRGY